MKCFVDGCEHPPVAEFVWPWGETGLVCAHHRIILAQKSKRLNRDVVITPLQSGTPAPLTRDERIASKARIMTLEEELDEAKSRGMDLYRQLEELKAQLVRANRNAKAADEELKALLDERDSLRQLLGEAQLAAARENDELQQLRALVPS
jgi:uncharacterized phage infection (PIP) family protein YhgE